MARRKQGAPGTGAGCRGETNLPHITWPELRERYHEARTFEERLGLIHATRRATTGVQQADAIEEAERLLTRVRFLTEVGSEVDVTERDPELRWQIRTTLSRYCLPNVLREPIQAGRCDAEITRAWRASAAVLADFFAASESHYSGIDNDCRKDVHAFLAARWKGCAHPDDNDDRARGTRISRQEKDLIAPITILQALVHTGHYELLAEVWDAAPLLYQQLEAYFPEGTLMRKSLQWFPGGLSTREIFESLHRSEKARRAFAEDRDAILDACGSRIDGTITEAAIVKALLELLARLHHKFAELERESGTAQRLPFPRTPADATTE